jgi:hypothetical protein
MRKLLVLLTAMPLIVIAAKQLIPTADGTTWLYDLTEEAGEEFAFAPNTAGPDGKIHRVTAYRIHGTQQASGKNLLRFEMHRDGIVTNTDLMTVDERGIFCAGRINEYGELTPLEPPQSIVTAPLRTGAQWDFDGKMGEFAAHQHYDVIGEEDVDVPAGKFRAFHIHCEQTRPMLMTIDRWFADGVGIVKDITTTKMPDGDLLRRITLQLKEPPKVAPRPEVKPVAPPKKVSVTVGAMPIGSSINQFAADIPKIYARWQGRGVRVGAKIRAVWIAENVAGVAPPDYTVDEANAVANSPDTHGVFTLSRPDEGWTPGDYRVDLYLEAELTDSAKLKITK